MGGDSGAGDRPKLGLRMAGADFLSEKQTHFFNKCGRLSMRYLDFMQGCEFQEEGLTIW